MFTSCHSTRGWKTGKWLSGINNGVELNIPTLPTRSSIFSFFEGDDNIVCLHWQRRVTLSLHVYPKHDTVRECSARSRKEFTRHLGFLLGESTSAQVPAHRLTISKSSGPVYQSLDLAEWKEETSDLWSALWSSVALWCASVREAMWGITWHWSFIHAYK